MTQQMRIRFFSRVRRVQRDSERGRRARESIQRALDRGPVRDGVTRESGREKREKRRESVRERETARRARRADKSERQGERRERRRPECTGWSATATARGPKDLMREDPGTKTPGYGIPWVRYQSIISPCQLQMVKMAGYGSRGEVEPAIEK